LKKYERFMVTSKALAIALTLAVGCLHAQMGPLTSPGKAPQAKSQEELDAYLDVVTAVEPADVIRLTGAFAQKFSASELLSSVYQAQLHAYEQLDDFEGMLAAGRRSLAGSPDNLNTLLSLSSAIAKRAGSRPDRSRLLSEAKSYADRVLARLDTIRLSHKLSPEDWRAQKQQMQSEARGVLGLVALQSGRLAEALQELRSALTLAPAPQGVQYLQFGLAQVAAGEKQGAEETLRRAVALGPDSVRQLASDQLKRLERSAASSK